MRRRKGAVEEVLRQRRAIERQQRDVDRARGIQALAPDRLGVAVQRDRELYRLAEVHRIDMQLDLDAVRMVLARLVQHDVAARHQAEAALALEEEAGRIRQAALAEQRADARDRERAGFDHPALRPGSAGGAARAAKPAPARARATGAAGF